MGPAGVLPMWLILSVLACIGAASYFNTLQAGFTYDDFYAVVMLSSRLSLVICVFYSVNFFTQFTRLLCQHLVV